MGNFEKVNHGVQPKRKVVHVYIVRWIKFTRALAAGIIPAQVLLSRLNVDRAGGC